MLLPIYCCSISGIPFVKAFLRGSSDRRLYSCSSACVASGLQEGFRPIRAPVPRKSQIISPFDLMAPHCKGVGRTCQTLICKHRAEATCCSGIVTTQAHLSCDGFDGPGFEAQGVWRTCIYFFVVVYTTICENHHQEWCRCSWQVTLNWCSNFLSVFCFFSLDSTRLVWEVA